MSLCGPSRFRLQLEELNCFRLPMHDMGRYMGAPLLNHVSLLGVDPYP